MSGSIRIVGNRLLLLLMGFFVVNVATAQEKKADPAAPAAPAAAASAPSITFLDPAAASAILADDKTDPYYSRMNLSEISARLSEAIEPADQDAARTRLMAMHQKETQAFTEQEQAAIKALVVKLHAILQKDYPQFAAQPWVFIKVSRKVEGGLPHTRNQCILFSEDVCKGIAESHARSPEPLFVSRWGRLLVHEQSHVLQRKSPELFKGLYTGLWQFTKAKKIEGRQWADLNRVTNPDATDVDWIWTQKKDGQAVKHYWGQLVFTEGPAPKKMGADFNSILIEMEPAAEGFKVKLDENGKPVQTRLREVAEYRGFFEPANQIDHPNEIFADMFSRLIGWDHIDNKSAIAPGIRERVEKMLIPQRAEFRKMFKAKDKP